MKVSAWTISRTILLALALINHLLTVTGHNPIPYDDAMLEQYVAWTFDAIAAIWAWWRNNSFTPAAIKGDQLMKQIKRGR